MSPANERREPDMDRRIPRRDSLKGLAIGATAAFTNPAIDEAHRAIEELFVKNGLT